MSSPLEDDRPHQQGAQVMMILDSLYLKCFSSVYCACVFAYLSNFYVISFAAKPLFCLGTQINDV